MKKLILDPETLEIESFDTDALSPRPRGTVAGQGGTNREEDCTVGTGCYTDDACCGAASVGDACGTSGKCFDISVCYGTLC